MRPLSSPVVQKAPQPAGQARQVTPAPNRTPAATLAPPAMARDVARFQLAASVASFALAVPLCDILSTTRGMARAAFARQVAMYLAHVGFEMSLARVAVASGRDRSTVAHACHLIEDRREQPAFDAWLEQLEASLGGLPAPLVGWTQQ